MKFIYDNREASSRSIIQPSDLRFNAVLKMIYRKYYSDTVLNQLWNESKRLGYSIKGSIELTARILANDIRKVY